MSNEAAQERLRRASPDISTDAVAPTGGGDATALTDAPKKKVGGDASALTDAPKKKVGGEVSEDAVPGKGAAAEAVLTERYDGWYEHATDGTWSIKGMNGWYLRFPDAVIEETASKQRYNFDPRNGKVYDSKGKLKGPNVVVEDPLAKVYAGWTETPKGNWMIDGMSGQYIRYPDAVIREVKSGVTYNFDPKNGKVYDSSGNLLGPKAAAKGPDPKTYAGWKPYFVGADDAWIIEPLAGSYTIDPNGHEIVDTTTGKRRYSFDPRNGKVYDAKGTLLAPKAEEGAPKAAAKAGAKGPDPKTYAGWKPYFVGAEDAWIIEPLDGFYTIDPNGHEIVDTTTGKRRYSFDPRNGKVYDAKGTLLAPK